MSEVQRFWQMTVLNDFYHTQDITHFITSKSFLYFIIIGNFSRSAFCDYRATFFYWRIFYDWHHLLCTLLDGIFPIHIVVHTHCLFIFTSESYFIVCVQFIVLLLLSFILVFEGTQYLSQIGLEPASSSFLSLPNAGIICVATNSFIYLFRCKFELSVDGGHDQHMVVCSSLYVGIYFDFSWINL